MERWAWGVVGLFVAGCGAADVTVVDDGLLASLPREEDTGVMIVDTDLPAESPGEVAAILGDGASVGDEQALTVNVVAGRDDVWPRAMRSQLTYCVDVAGFGRDAAAVIAALRAATADWQRAANVQFTHVTAEDSRCSRTNTRVLFDVRPAWGRPYLARSFLPSSGRSSRELIIDGTALPPPHPLTLTGAVRHELGHILGLRHEHTRSRSNPCYEDSNWRAVTPYDVRSVMHYPQCLGVRGRDLTLTASDLAGIHQLYP